MTTSDIIDVSEAVDIVNRLAQAKSRQSLADAMAIYHPEGVLESPPLGTRSVGPDIERAIAGWFVFAPDYEVRLDGHGMDRGTLCSWGTALFTPALTRGGAVPNGRQVRVPVFILFQFAEGRVAWESFHFDVFLVARQCGVDPSALVYS